MENMSKDKNIELIEFLNQEKLHKKIHSKKIFTFYNKCLIKCIYNLNNKFHDIENKNLCLVNGINMIFYIFYVLIFYTNNIKLTIFLLERSILFYSEFIIMSQDKKLIDQICFVPNINDALFFTYKKTIGPIELCKMKTKNEQIYIRDISRVINIIYNEVVVNSDENNLLDNLNLINSELSNNIYEIFFYLDENNRKLFYSFTNDIFEKNLDYNIKIKIFKDFLSNISNTKRTKVCLEDIYADIEYNEIMSEEINTNNQIISQSY